MHSNVSADPEYVGVPSPHEPIVSRDHRLALRGILRIPETSVLHISRPDDFGITWISLLRDKKHRLSLAARLHERGL
jgi:hypothetical protein